MEQGKDLLVVCLAAVSTWICNGNNRTGSLQEVFGGAHRTAFVVGRPAELLLRHHKSVFHHACARFVTLLGCNYRVKQELRSPHKHNVGKKQY